MRDRARKVGLEGQGVEALRDRGSEGQGDSGERVGEERGSATQGLNTEAEGYGL